MESPDRHDAPVARRDAPLFARARALARSLARPTIVRKLFLGFAPVLLVGLVCAVLVQRGTGDVATELQRVIETEQPTSAAAYEMEINSVETQLDVMRYVETAEPALRGRVADDVADFRRSKAVYDRLAGTPEASALGARIGLLFDRYEADGRALMDRRDAVLRGDRVDPGQTRAIARRFAAVREEMDRVLDDGIQRITERDLAAADARARERTDAVLGLFFVALVAGLAVALAAALLLARGIVRPVRELARAARRVGAGDLEHEAPVDSEDEIGELAEAFNAMTRRRREVESEVEAARDEALEASRMKSQFLANMSHEIRTPMNGVVGMTELLLDTRLSPEQREFAELVRVSGETLVAVVNDILDFSKIEAGRLEFDEVDFDLGGTIEDVCDLMAERASAKDVELTALVDAELPPAVRGDDVRVRQILTNLISNAVKFTEAGEVTVRAIPDGVDGTRIRFEVVDTGIGIPPEALERLFEPFSQADASTTRRFGGTGLGLAIVKELVGLMGGEIGAESALGKGSRFWFTLPFAQPEEPTEPPLEQGGLTGIRLLVVDDTETNRRMVLHHAAAWGLAADCASDGAEALVRLRAAASAGEPFDCVALDVQMPGMDGFELAAAIRAERGLPEPALVMLTSGLDERRRAREAGIDRYLSKPVRRERLRRALLAAVGRLEADDPRTAEEARATVGGVRPSVLVAEDNEVNQTLARHMLEKRGYTAEVVSDGRQAVDAMRTGTYAAVLMDCQMPEIDGYEATRQIRRRERGGRRVPIIAMTAHSMRGDREKCLAAGMDDYLAKPLDAQVFGEVLGRWVASAPPRPTSPVPDTNSTGAPAREPVSVDPQALTRLREELGGTEVLATLVALFAEQTPPRLDGLGAAVDAEDGEGAAALAHTMKGGAVSLGATPMAALCRELEQRAHEGRLAGAEDLVEALRAEYARALDVLRLEVGQEAVGA